MNQNINGWLKLFSGGFLIQGTDDLVDSQQVSWRNTPLDGIRAVSIGHNFGDSSLTGWIDGQGKYWQSDDFHAPLRFNSTVKGIRTARRIEKQITPSDKLVYVIKDNLIEEHNSLGLIITSAEDPHLNPSFAIPLTSDQIGQWIVVEINISEKKVSYYFSKAMI